MSDRRTYPAIEGSSRPATWIVGGSAGFAGTPLAISLSRVPAARVRGPGGGGAAGAVAISRAVGAVTIPRPGTTKVAGSRPVSPTAFVTAPLVRVGFVTRER